MNDSDWAKSIVEEDEAARARFVLSFHDSVFRWLRYLTSCEESARELTQETFVQALQSIARYEGRASLATWLHRIAYFRYTHWLRLRRREQRWHAPLEAAEEYADPVAASHWEALCLDQALAQLSEAHRDTFVLHYVQQLSVPEVAEVLSVPSGTVQSRLFHARQRLRELLRDTLDAKPMPRKGTESTEGTPVPGKPGIHEVTIQ